MGIVIMPKNDYLVSAFTMASRHAHSYKVLLILLVLSALSLSGCGSLLVGAATTGATVAAQERSIGDAVDDLTIRTHLNQLFLEDNVEFSMACVVGGYAVPLTTGD